MIQKRENHEPAVGLECLTEKSAIDRMFDSVAFGLRSS